jgi:DNA-binding GntR family transcriptional regulator
VPQKDFPLAGSTRVATAIVREPPYVGVLTHAWFLVYKISNTSGCPTAVRGIREELPMSPPGRPKGELLRSAQREGILMSAGALQTELPSGLADHESDAKRPKLADAPGGGDGAAPLNLQPINTTVSLRDQAYAALKQAIIDADIYSHDEELRLDERQLSQSLGVSRTPIREAMTLLEQEGFLRTVPRRGIFIVRKTKKQIIEMIEMWAAIESMAARLATTNASDEEIAGLRTMFGEFRTSTPAEHIDEYSDANIAFHQAIIRLSGSHLMGATLENLFLHVRAIRRMTISQSDRAARSIVDHMRIIEALEKRDTELAERLVRQHSLDLAAYVEKHCDFLE